ncbi:unnamed protein product [Sympodiomycopsis kandeliae]
MEGQVIRQAIRLTKLKSSVKKQKERHDTLKDQLKETSCKYMKLQTQVDSLVQELQTVKEENVVLRRTVEDVTAKLDIMEEEVQDLKGKTQVHDKIIPVQKVVQSTIEEVSDRTDALIDRTNAINETISEHTVRLRHLDDDVSRVERKLKTSKMV